MSCGRTSASARFAEDVSDVAEVREYVQQRLQSELEAIRNEYRVLCEQRGTVEIDLSELVRRLLD